MTVYITGDIHGDKCEAIGRAEQISNFDDDNIMIIAGDASLEYGNHNMGAAKKAMNKMPCSWLIMRGNHDNCYYANHWQDDNWHVDTTLYNAPVIIQDKYPNIHYIMDEGGIYNVQGNKILFLPGAYSIDKDYRLAKGWPYNPKEQLSDEDFQDLYNSFMESNTRIDYAVSHTCPLQLESQIQYLFLDFIDQSSVDKRTEKWLDKFYNQLIQEPSFKHWYFGHFHDTKKITDKVSMLYHTVKKLGE